MTRGRTEAGGPRTQVILALGSNVGDRRRHLSRGVWFLSRRVILTGISRVVESEPWGPVAQGPFLNLALRGETGLPPLALLEILHAAERDAGRTRIVPQGPRTLDVDLILYGTERIHQAGLTVPHPHWRERPFVAPLVAEVGSDLTDPEAGRSVAAIGADWGLPGYLPPGVREVEPLRLPSSPGLPAPVPGSGSGP